MKVEYLNPFVKSVVDILEATVGKKPAKGKVFLRDKYPYKTEDVAILVGMTGMLAGQVVISMGMNCAKGIAAIMLMEENLQELDEYAQSALAEIANMVTANATIGLSEIGCSCDITPPSVVTGQRLEISCQEHVKTIVIPLEMDIGHVDVNISIVETAKYAR